MATALIAAAIGRRKKMSSEPCDMIRLWRSRRERLRSPAVPQRDIPAAAASEHPTSTEA